MTDWRAFLLAWLRVHGDRPVTAHELCQSADPEADQVVVPEWTRTFPRTVHGDLPSTKSLGRILTHRLDSPAGDLVVRSVIDPHTKYRLYWVDRADQPHPINRLAGSTPFPDRSAGRSIGRRVD